MASEFGHQKDTIRVPFRDFTDITEPLKTTRHNKAEPTTSFAKDQVWRMYESRVYIWLVGKKLVHYKLLKGDLKRAPNSLTSKTALHYFLKKNNAVLSQAG